MFPRENFDIAVIYITNSSTKKNQIRLELFQFFNLKYILSEGQCKKIEGLFIV
jgi:hypothetical protein